MGAFHDEAAIEALQEQIIDALRPVGITVDKDAIHFGIVQGALFVALQGLVRDSAKDNAQQDQETKAMFNQMMAQNNRAMQDQKRSEIADLAKDPDALQKWLFEGGQECPHENVHEGLCLDCQQQVED